MGEFTIRTLCSECGAVFTYEQRDPRDRRRTCSAACRAERDRARQTVA
jgi:hypothetical protein